MPFFVYVLQNSDDRFYIGQTSDLELRLQRHNEGKVFWTRSRGPWKVVHSERFKTRSEVMKQERRLKGLKSKEALERYLAQW